MSYGKRALRRQRQHKAQLRRARNNRFKALREQRLENQLGVSALKEIVRRCEVEEWRHTYGPLAD